MGAGHRSASKADAARFDPWMAREMERKWVICWKCSGDGCAFCAHEGAVHAVFGKVLEFEQPDDGIIEEEPLQLGGRAAVS